MSGKHKRLTLLDTRHLHYDKKTRTFSAELSSLPLGNTGLTLKVEVKSHVTGRIELFEHVKTLHDDGDIAGWEFYCRKFNVRLVIIND